MNAIRFILPATVAATALSASATVYYYVGGGRGDTTNAAKWQDANGVNPAYAPGSSSAADTDEWVVKDGRQIWQVGTVANSVTHFYGSKITFGEIGGTKAYYYCESQDQNASAYFHCPAYFANGEFRARNNNSKRGYVNGTIIVTAPSSAPFALNDAYGNYTEAAPHQFTFNASISSAAGCALASTGNGWCQWTFAGDLSGYRGTMNFSHGHVTITFGANTGAIDMERLAFGAGTKVTVNNATPIHVGTLAIGGGDTFLFNVSAGTCPSLVADAATVNGRVVFNLSGTPTTGAANRFPLLTSATGGLSRNAFEVNAPDCPAAAFSGAELITGEDGTSQTLYAVFEPVVKLKVSDQKYKDRGTYTNAMQKAASWTDAALPHSGAHYVVDSTATSRATDDDGYGTLTYLRSPNSQSGSYRFPGESLTIGAASRLTTFVSGFSVGNGGRLVIKDGGQVWCGQSQTTTFSDMTFVAESGTVRIGAYMGNYFNLAGDLAGGAELVLGTQQSSQPQGNYRLYGDNSSFKGTITCTLKSSGSFSTCSTLRIRDGGNLGGALDAFEPRALVLTKYAVLQTEASNEITVPASRNRGLAVDGAGRVNTAAAAHTLHLGMPLTIDGDLFKEGAGTLTLDADMNAATQGSRLVVTNGTLAIRSSKAVDGLTVCLTPASGGTARLVLKPDFADGSDLTRYGIWNVSAATPFATAGGAKIDFAFDATKAEVLAAHGKQGLFTVSNGALASFKALLPALLPVPLAGRPIQEIPVAGMDATTLAVALGQPATVIFAR